MRWLAITIAAILALSLLPTNSVSASSKHHWNGYVLDREPISDHLLIDENYDYYSLKKGTHDVIVVAFIFTTCPDVCPVITSNLVSAEQQLGGVDYQFISITVDPATDSPGKLRSYMQNYGASWPHLTAELEDIQEVWDDFMIQVNTTEIQNHDHDHSGDNEKSENPEEMSSTVMVALPNGEIYSQPVELNGLDQLTASAYKNGWTVNSSSSQWGTFISGLNDDSPPDYSWWWKLHTWNSSTETWQKSQLGIDSIETGHLAFAPNTTENSVIPSPQGDYDSFTILQSNGSVDVSVMDELNAWHMSLSALNSFEAPADSDLGHYMTTIDGYEAPADLSWSWALHYWDYENDSWVFSNDGMDSLVDKQHILWAPNSTNASTIPAPDDYMMHKLGVVYADGSTELFDSKYYTMDSISAIQHTNRTLSLHQIDYTESNSEIISIGTSESNYSLYAWHNMGSFSHWISVDDTADQAVLMEDSDHFAWVAEGQDASNLPSPFADPNADENETSTSHSTQTFILDSDWEPKVVFVGYDWNVDYFVEDVKRAARLNADPDDNGLPGFTVATLSVGIGLAIIASSRDD